MKTQVSFTAVLGLLIFFAAVVLAIMSPLPLKSVLSFGFGALAVLGAWVLLSTSFRGVRLISNDTQGLLKNYFPVKLFIWQFLVLCLSFISFNLVLSQSQNITRLQPLSSEQLFGILKSHIGILGFLPWILYAVVGVGLAYFSFCEQKPPLLHQMIVANPLKKSHYFFRSVFSIINEMSITVPFLFLAGTAVMLLGEGLCGVWGWSSPLFFSARTAVVWFLIVLWYRKKHVRLAEWMQEQKISMGGRLVIYILGLTALLLAYQAFWVLLPKMFDHPEEMSPTHDKSILVGAFSEGELKTRVYLLIGGWWAVWIPWISSLVARYAYGFKVWQALLNACIVPALCFWGYLKMDVVYLERLVAYMQMPLLQIVSALVVVAFVGVSLRTVQNFSDLAKGAMLPVGNLPKRALKKVMSTFLVRLIPYLYASYVLGWFPTQVIGTLGAIFMLILILPFVWVLRVAAFSQRCTIVGMADVGTVKGL